MTTTDLSRKGKNNYKKTASIASALVLYSQVVGTNTHNLYELPANALITDAGVVVDVVANGSITVDFGFDGGNELGNDLDIHTSVGYKTPTLATSGISGATGVTTKAPRLLTGTGKNVTAVFSAGPTAGKFHFIVEYIEYTLTNGDLTNYA